MKKINYLVLPLLAVPFVIGCSCGGTKSAKVSEEEFNSATTNKDINYLQISSTYKVLMDDDTGETMTATVTTKVSPTAYYMSLEDDEGSMEIYSTLSSDKTKVTYTMKMEGEWSEEETVNKKEAMDDQCWADPETVSPSHLIEEAGSSKHAYSDFKYTTKGYYAELKAGKENDATPNLNKATIFFTGKKVTKFTLVSIYKDAKTKEELQLANQKFSYTYKEVTPTDPRK